VAFSLSPTRSSAFEPSREVEIERTTQAPILGLEVLTERNLVVEVVVVFQRPGARIARYRHFDVLFVGAAFHTGAELTVAPCA
jgi:hypothetical protein